MNSGTLSRGTIGSSTKPHALRVPGGWMIVGNTDRRSFQSAACAYGSSATSAGRLSRYRAEIGPATLAMIASRSPSSNSTRSMDEAPDGTAARQDRLPMDFNLSPNAFQRGNLLRGLLPIRTVDAEVASHEQGPVDEGHAHGEDVIFRRTVLHAPIPRCVVTHHAADAT